MSDENKDIPDLPDTDFDVAEEKPAKSKNMKMLVIGGVIFAVILVSASAAWIMLSKKKVKKHAPVVQQETSNPVAELPNPLLASAPIMESSSALNTVPQNNVSSEPLLDPMDLKTDDKVKKSEPPVDKIEKITTENKEVTAQNEKKRDTILVHKKKIQKKQAHAYHEKSVKAPKKDATKDIEQMVDHDETRFDRIF